MCTHCDITVSILFFKDIKQTGYFTPSPLAASFLQPEPTSLKLTEKHCDSIFTLFLFMTKARACYIPVLSYSPVGLVEAAMVAAPEAGVSTLSMAQSYLLNVLLIVDC